jgi:hypothetical protein
MMIDMERVARPLTDAELAANREALQTGSPPPYIQDLGTAACLPGLSPNNTWGPKASTRPMQTTGDRLLAKPPNSLRR